MLITMGIKFPEGVNVYAMGGIFQDMEQGEALIRDSSTMTIDIHIDYVWGYVL